MIKFLKNNIFLVLLIFLSVPAIAALFHFGFYGASDDLHIAWLYEMDKILRLGQIPPRFVPDLSFGFGYPLFNFVFPLPFYIGELFRLLSFSFVDCVKMVFGFSLVASGIAMFFFLKEVLPEFFSLAGALIYVYTPYRSTDVYVRGAIGESLSFVFLPILLYAAVKIYKSASENKTIDRKGVFLMSLGLAGLILSHDIVSYMFFPFLLILILIFVLWSKYKKKLFIDSLLGIVGGLLISLYFWLPALLESRLMTYGTVFNFSDHFPTIKQLLTSYFGYGASVPGPYDSISFYLGTLNWLLIVVGTLLAILFWKRLNQLEKIVVIWAAVIFVISFFMMNHRSAFFWRTLPFLPYFQFPWRFLTMTTLVSVVFLLPFKYLNLKYLNYLIPGSLVVLAILLNFIYFKPHDFLGRTDSYYINKYIPTPLASAEYLTIQEEYLRLPLGVEKRPDKNYPPIFSDKKINASVLETNGVYSKIKIDVPAETLIYYSKYYFPGWIAKIDGKLTKITEGKPFGQITVDVPEGEHVLEFNFIEVGYKVVLDIVSAGALLIVVTFLIFKK
jgi:hypothetical protein